MGLVQPLNISFLNCHEFCLLIDIVKYNLKPNHLSCWHIAMNKHVNGRLEEGGMGHILKDKLTYPQLHHRQSWWLPCLPKKRGKYKWVMWRTNMFMSTSLNKVPERHFPLVLKLNRWCSHCICSCTLHHMLSLNVPYLTNLFQSLILSLNFIEC